MNLKYQTSQIVSNVEISDGIFKMVVEDRNEIKAGQFYMLKNYGTTFLPRPISICEKDEETITFVYAVVGNGTREFAKLEKGDKIYLTGPLGNGFDVETQREKIALVAGGIGTAPMVETAKKIRSNNPNTIIDVFVGFRDDIYLIEELKKYADNVIITTNSGKHGHKGFVTEVLKPEEYNEVLCCGPEVMMKAVIQLCKKTNTKVYVSMEKHMACGVGACLVCTCKTKDGHKRTCKDGPVFDGYYVEL